MSHLGYLVAAYGLIFAGIFLYVVFIARRQASLEAELKEMEALMRQLRDSSAPAAPSGSAL